MKTRSATAGRALQLAKVIGRHFVNTQLPYGRPDPLKSRFARKTERLGAPHLHSVPFLCRACYWLYDATGDLRYRDAADRYVTFLMAVLHDPKTPVSSIRRSWLYGMALDCYAEFKRCHPEEPCFDHKATAIYAWLGEWRWNRPSRFRVGYTDGPWLDNEFSDDLCHVGRGLVSYFAVSGKPEVLKDAKALARFFVSGLKTSGASQAGYQPRPAPPAGTNLDHDDSYVAHGIFSRRLGTWAVGPWPVGKFEHVKDSSAAEVGWGFSARGVTEFLMRLLAHIESANLRKQIATRCLQSLQWQIRCCQFPNGAIGLFGRDDEWLGQTAGFLLSYLQMHEAGLFRKNERREIDAAAAKAWRWLKANTTKSFALKHMGYRKVTGQTLCNHPENAAWLLAWVIQALLAAQELEELPLSHAQ